MEGVTEFVEQRARVLEADQDRLAVPALGEVHDVEHQRANLAIELVLLAQGRHPGPAALGRPGEKVAEEQAEMAPVRRPHLPGADVGMPDRHVGSRGERDPEQPARGFEGGFDHAVEPQIWLDLALGKVAALAAQLLGVIAPVPGREREVAALGPDHLLHGVAVGECAPARRRPDFDRRPRAASGVLAMASSSR